MIKKQDGNKAAEETSVKYEKRIKAKFDLMDACVRLITIHGRPVFLIEDEAFRDNMDIIPQRETINSHKMYNRTIEESNTIRRNKFMDEVKGRLIFLEADTATCMARSFLGINIQFVKVRRIHIRTLGVVKLFRRYTANCLKEVILNI